MKALLYVSAILFIANTPVAAGVFLLWYAWSLEKDHQPLNQTE